MKTTFLDKLIERLDRLDPKSVQAQFLRLAQERGLLETIFQSIQEGVIAIDGEGRIRYANRAAERLLGFSLESAQGRPVSRYVRDIDWVRILDLDTHEWSRLISKEIEISYPEHRFLNFYVVPLSSEDSSEKGAVVILRDVLDERRKEEGLVESERLNAVKLLAAGVAHEIGNPLNALNIHLQLLDREIRAIADGEKSAGDPPDPATRVQEFLDLHDLVEVARNEVSRLDLIITQFLRAVRPAKPKMATCDMETLIKETLSLLKQEIQNRKIEVGIDFKDSLPKVAVDRNQIKQAFFNIIRNAFDSMPDGGALKISLSANDTFFIATFRDTGHGIKPEDLGRIFEPYHTTKRNGSGLGLMIVQRIVQDHGGQIEVVSKPETGTSFAIHLPRSERRVRLLEAPPTTSSPRVPPDGERTTPDKEQQEEGP